MGMLQYQPTEKLSDLISILAEKISLDKIFLLGVSEEGQPVNSIFRPVEHNKERVNGYFMLLLTRSTERRSDDMIQDMLEQQNKYRIPIHLIVYPVRSFYDWLRAGQSFALRVVEDAPMIYNAGITKLPPLAYELMVQNRQKEERQARESLHRAAAFVSAANLLINMKNYLLASFLLHQATEHACLSFILQNIGLRTGTHNIDKLLRYTLMVNSDLFNVFPRNTEEDIELFRLLQKAYIHSRYKDNYDITKAELMIIDARVKQLINIIDVNKETQFRVVKNLFKY